MLVAFLVIVPIAAFSQSRNAYAFIIYAEGQEMSVYRNDQLTTYDVVADSVIGMPLLPNDLIQTEAQTFVEIQIMPSRTVIKVAENTTFRIQTLGGDGGGVFDMRYGRLRAKVERITGNEEFEVRGSSAVAGVRGTDFGYDLTFQREGVRALDTKIYCF